MEFPSSQADSPVKYRGTAGPSRSRIEARQHRNSALKPYDRPLFAEDSHKSVLSRGRINSTASAYSSKSKNGSKEEDSKKNGSGGGLLSGLREAIFSRPLSWLQGSGSKSQLSSAGLPSHAQQSAAQRLAASVKGKEGEDIESHRGGLAGKAKPIAPPPSTSRQLMTPQQSTITPTLLTPARSPSPARSSASAVIQSHGRQRLSLGTTSQSPRIGGGSVLSTPGYRRGGSLRPEVAGGSVSGLAASQSSPSYAFRFGSEQRRLAGMSSSASAHGGMSPSPLAYSSYNPLPSKSPFAMNRHSVARSSAAGSSFGVEKSPRYSGSVHLGTPSRSRPGSLFGGDFYKSRAGSVADSRMSTSSQTPKRRDWSSLKLAPPKVDMSEGEELMQAYMALRSGTTPMKGSVHPAMQQPDTLMMEFGAGPSAFRAAGLYNEGSLKRGASMSVDGDENMSESASRKRQKQMVWDHELGFISKKDLRARQTPKPVAKNEAEKLLNALEGMRSPMVGLQQDWEKNSRASTPSRQMMSVSVPLPVPERSGTEVGQRRPKVEDLTKTLSPYSRAAKQRSKLSQSIEPEEGKGLKSRLRKPASKSQAEASPNKGKEEKREKLIGSDASMDGDDHEEVSSSEEEVEEVVEPPRRKLGASIGADKKEETKTLRSGKVLPPSPLKKKEASSLSALSPSKLNASVQQTSKPLSKVRLEISASGTSAANRQRASHQSQPPPPSSEPKPASSTGGSSNFKVLGSSTGTPSERSRSSLRQGAEKTSRSHVKSGRIGLDDDDDDEDVDLPGTEELNKIKLPTNLFPQGFTFSGSSSTPSRSNNSNSSSITSSEPVSSSEDAVKALPAPSDDSDKQQSSKNMSFSGKEDASTTASGNSLFSRLGGFAPESQSSKSSTPSFSFSAPTKTSEPAKPAATKPLFSFQPTTPSLESGASTTPKAAPPSSNFFSAPSSEEVKSPFPAASASSGEAKNDGPVPNFFASSLAKTSSAPGSESSKSFSFGGATTPKPETTSKPSSSPFTFAAAPSTHTPASTSTSSPAITTPSFSFTPKPSKGSSKTESTSAAAPSMFQGFGKTAESSSKDNSQSVPTFAGFGAPSKSSEDAAKSGSPFSFGGTSSASTPPTFSGFSTDSNKKRGASDDEEPPSKKSNGFGSSPSFSFASGATTSAPKTDGGFSFSAPKPSDDTADSSKSFSFSTPSQPKATGAGDGNAKAATNPLGGGGGGFNFGTPSTPFGGGGKTDSMDTSPSSTSLNNSNNTASSNLFGGSASAPKPTLSFGGPLASSTAGTTPSSTVASTNAHTGFMFGSTAPAKSDSASNQSMFNFGGQNNTAESGGSGNMFGQQSSTNSSTPTISNPFANSSVISPTTGGGFGGNTTSSGFGSTSNENSRQGSPAAFTFGGGSSNNATSQPMGGFGSGFGSNQSQSQQSPAPSAGPTFTFGAAPSNGSGLNTAAAGTSSGGGFSFSMPAAAAGGATNAGNNSTSFMQPGSSGSIGSAPSSPFVFGSSAGGGGNSTPPPTQPPPPSGFQFGMAASPAPPQSPGGGNLFNMGAPPPPGSGNRPVRGMPSRRKR